MPSLVFISWSGERAFSVARALRESLRVMVPHATPWFSDRDIDAGSFWDNEMRSRILNAAFAVVCVTPENLQRAWLNYEAGAIAEKPIPVCPYLLAVEKNELQPGPLSRLNAVSANVDGTRKLMHSINKATTNEALQEDVIDRLFDNSWPSLEAELAAIPRDAAQSAVGRSAESKVDEVLLLTQRIAERTSTLQPRGGLGIASLVRFTIEQSMNRLGVQPHEFDVTVHPDHAEGYAVTFSGSSPVLTPLTVHVGSDVDVDTLHNVARIGCKHIGIGNWS
jgi:hypothetical protein